MAFVVQKEFDAKAHLLNEFFKAPGPAVGTKTQQGKNLARHFGRKEGIAEALAAILTQERIAAYPLQEGHFEMVMSWDVEDALKGFYQEFPAPDKEKGLELLRQAYAALEELKLGDENFREHYAIRRRGQIESGKLSREFATEQDKLYWKQEADKAQHRSETMHALAGE